MKIIHTSDWHLGHVLYGYDRTFEQQCMLEQVRRIIEEQQPDALVVSGDVYHNSLPGAQVQRLFTDALLSIHRAAPEMEIVVTAGNHDSAARLEIDRNLWHMARVHVVGNISRSEGQANYDKHIIRIGDKGFVAAVPYVFEQNFPPAAEGQNRQQAFFQGLLNAVKQQNKHDLPVVLMAHLAVTGCDMTGHNVPAESIGSIETVPLSTFGQDYDYMALGHIHRPQTMRAGQRVARYSGSPLAVSFDEDYPHSLSLVELLPGQEPQITLIPIHNPRPLTTLPRKAVGFDDAIDALKAFNSNDASYIRLHVQADKGLPADAKERAVAATNGKQCSFCTFKITRSTPISDLQQNINLSAEEFRKMTPIDVAMQYMKRKGWNDDDFIEMMNQVVKQLNEEKRQ